MSGATRTATAVPDDAVGSEILLPVIVWAFPNLDGRLTPLAEGSLTVGRDTTCDVWLEGAEVSRVHAVIRRSATGHDIVDQGSKNGLHINGRRVGEATLTAGTVIRIGEWLGRVTLLPVQLQRTLGPLFTQPLPGLLLGPSMHAPMRHLKAAALSDLPIVLEGETGTGKERFAKATHAWSARKAGPFVAINCAAIPQEMAEAELFGYRKGAFTSADRSHVGQLRQAHGGTLLLDEIVEMPLKIQAKLLRALEEKEVLPLGEAAPVPIDVRVIAAAQGALEDAVQEGRFRADLAARLCGLTVRLPPLRERAEDVPYLFTNLLQKHAGSATPPAPSTLFLERLCLRPWPMNVRELDLLARRMLALHGPEPVLLPAHLPDAVADPRPASEPLAEAEPDSAPVTVEALLSKLRQHGGNVARAAAALGLTRQRAYRLLQQAGLDVDQVRREMGSGP